MTRTDPFVPVLRARSGHEVGPLSRDTAGVGQDPVEAAAKQPAPSHLAATMARTRSRVRCTDHLLAPAGLREPRAVIDDEARLPREIRVVAATRDAVQLSRLLTEPISDATCKSSARRSSPC
jgi:hypothetical protein